MHGLRSLAFKATEVEVGIFGMIWGSEIEGTEKEREWVCFFSFASVASFGWEEYWVCLEVGM